MKFIKNVSLLVLMSASAVCAMDSDAFQSRGARSSLAKELPTARVTEDRFTGFDELSSMMGIGCAARGQLELLPELAARFSILAGTKAGFERAAEIAEGSKISAFTLPSLLTAFDKLRDKGDDGEGDFVSVTYGEEGRSGDFSKEDVALAIMYRSMMSRSLSLAVERFQAAGEAAVEEIDEIIAAANKKIDDDANAIHETHLESKMQKKTRY